MIPISVLQGAFNGFVLCVLLSGPPACVGGPGKDSPKVGEAPPPIILKRMVQGPPAQEVSWEKLKGKVVVLEFWSTACAPCIRAIPHLNELVEQFQGKPVVFLSITEESGDHVQQFLKRQPMKGWVAEDGTLAATTERFHVEGIPTIFMVDATGKISAVTHPQKIEAKHLEEVLAGKPSTLPAPALDSEPDSLEVVARSTPEPIVLGISIAGPFPVPDGPFNFSEWKHEGNAFEAKKAYIKHTLAAFFRVDVKLVMESIPLPRELYDVRVVGPPGKDLELAAQFIAALKTAFGISVRMTNREVEVYSMTFASSNAAALKRTDLRLGGGERPGGFLLRGSQLHVIGNCLGAALNKPVIDATESSNYWHAELKWELSKAEQLLSRVDSDALELLSTNTVFLTSGVAPPGVEGLIGRDDLGLLRAELNKPPEQQFRPDPASVIRAAREQLGLELKPVRQVMKVIEVQTAR
jgi:uncharacterized protein (TIGR03435 family)